MKTGMRTIAPTLLMLVLLSVVESKASQQGEPAQTQTPPARSAPRPKPLLDQVKQFIARVGASIDATKSTPTMVVSNLPDARGGKTNIVIVHDRRKNFLGFYIYNFGSVKEIQNREEVYKYLLSINDSITVGSFFVDGDEDIGYKYLMNADLVLNQKAFDSVYLTMAAVAREHRGEIRKLLDGGKAPGGDR